MASDRLARELLNMTSDPNVADPVKLAAIKDALDRSGIQAKTAVSVEVSTKPFELVFEKISAGPREPNNAALAIEGQLLDDHTDNTAFESENDEILGEFDDDQIDDDLPRIEQDRDPDPRIIDVEIEAIDPAGYTDQVTSDDRATTTPDDPSSSASGAHSPDRIYTGPLGLTGPVGSGLMPLSDAVEAAAVMRAREAARIRDMRRR
jgi:hypothetical protein